MVSDAHPKIFQCLIIFGATIFKYKKKKTLIEINCVTANTIHTTDVFHVRLMKVQQA